MPGRDREPPAYRDFAGDRQVLALRAVAPGKASSAPLRIGAGRLDRALTPTSVYAAPSHFDKGVRTRCQIGPEADLPFGFFVGSSFVFHVK